MLEYADLKTIRHDSVPRPDDDVHSTTDDNHDIYNGDHRPPLSLLESSCLSSESNRHASFSTIDHGDPTVHTNPIDKMSINAMDSSINEKGYKVSLSASLDISDLAWASLPIYDEKPPSYSSELETADDRGQIETIPTYLCLEAGDATLDRPVQQEPSRLYRLNYGAVVRYRCGTSMHGCDEVRIGCNDEIPRWRKGSEIRYVVCTESFESPDAAITVADAAARAFSKWPDVGVRFKRVERDEPATFAIKYCDFRSKRRRYYARSFLPQDLPGELLVYQDALDSVDYLDNILAHEVGHILGLRHEFAAEKEKDIRSVPFGSENVQSIMNYFDHPSKLQVSKQDCEELARFYAYNQAEYDGLPLVDIEPHLHIFSKGGSASAMPALRDLSPNKLSSATSSYIGCSFL